MLPAEQGLGEPGSQVLVAVDGSYAGTILGGGYGEDDAAAAIRFYREQGVKTAMLTGDGEAAARAVAQQVGIQEVHAASCRKKNCRRSKKSVLKAAASCLLVMVLTMHRFWPGLM